MNRKSIFQRLFLLCVCCVLSCTAFTVYGRQLSSQEARQVAEVFWNRNVSGRPRVALVPGARRQAPSVAPRYYVFDTEDRSGFVIVSGDDRVRPVLGYATTGGFDEERLPEALQQLLADYEKQIASLPAEAAAGENVAAAYTGEKLLATAEWNQREPFNKFCPDGSVTGCVATAMGIVMQYHQWPEQGAGQHAYEWTPGNGNAARVLSADFGNTTYDWGAMPLDYTSYTERQATAVATLLYHAGVAVDMDYGLNASSANFYTAWRALVDYFRYSPTSKMRDAADYTTEQWMAMLRKEIDADCPVWYGGQGTGGHAFVLDGYQNDLFHINWGGGYCNGYFSIGRLTPNSHDYSYDQVAIFELRPNYEGKVYSPLRLYVRDGFSGIASNHTTIKAGDTFEVDCSGIINNGDDTFDGQVAVVLCGADGTVKRIMGTTSIGGLGSYYYRPYCLISCLAPVSAMSGDRICLMSKQDGEDTYYELLTYGNDVASLPAFGYVPETVRLELDYDEAVFVPEGYNKCFYQGNPVKHAACPVFFRYDSSVAERVVARINGQLCNPTYNWYSGTTRWNLYYINDPVEDVYRFSLRGYRNADMQGPVTVHVGQAGTLSEIVAAKGLNMDLVNKLIVTGNVDARDFAWLKAQATLEDIDMERTTVKAYGNSGANAIPLCAFEDCSNLKSFVMPAGITAIYHNAFMGTGLESIAIPGGVEYIGLNVFNSCWYLREVYAYNPAPVFINWCVFNGTPRGEGAILHVPVGSKSLYEAAAEWCEFTYIVDDLTYAPVEIILDENSNTFPVAEDTYAAKVTINRTLKAGQWSTLCLPFDLDEEQIARAGISDVQMLAGVTVKGDTGFASFAPVSEMEAGKPYLVRANEETALSFSDVFVKVAEPEALAVDGAVMQGSYCRNSLEGVYYISDDKFYYTDIPVAFKGFRASIVLTGGAGVKSLSISLGDATGIENMEAVAGDALVDVYTVSGARVKSGVRASGALDGLVKGIYIVNGKKVVK